MLSLYATPAATGAYAAAVRVAQALVLFLIAVNYMFSPFVADLYARGERERLDGLYKALTRWVLAGTIPLCSRCSWCPARAADVRGGVRRGVDRCGSSSSARS